MPTTFRKVDQSLFSLREKTLGKNYIFSALAETISLFLWVNFSLSFSGKIKGKRLTIISEYLRYSNFPGYFPNRLFLYWNVLMALKKSILRKPGQYDSQKYNSE